MILRFQEIIVLALLTKACEFVGSKREVSGNFMPLCLQDKKYCGHAESALIFSWECLPIVARGYS